MMSARHPQGPKCTSSENVLEGRKEKDLNILQIPHLLSILGSLLKEYEKKKYERKN